jgi:hypothetical protein
MPPFDFVAYWLDRVAAVEPKDWRATGPAGLDKGLRSETATWCGRHLAADADPYRRKKGPLPEASVSKPGSPEAKPTIDLLRTRYDIDDLPAELIEGRNFTLARVAAETVLRGSPQARKTELLRLAGVLLSRSWPFQLPESLEEGSQFTSNPARRPGKVDAWEDQAMGGIRQGQLWFLCFRKVPGVSSYLNDMQWFPDAFRASLGP